jgi:hypothetical protein
LTVEGVFINFAKKAMKEKDTEILRLRIKKENLIKIASGMKVEEYREAVRFYEKIFWDSKKKEFYPFKKIHLYLGNVSDGLFCDLEIKMIRLEVFMNDIPEEFKKGDEAFTIYLGKIIEHNIPPELLT